MFGNNQYDDCNKIIDGIVLGNIKAASSEIILQQNGVTHILTVGSGLKPKFPLKYKYKVIEEYDIPSANLIQHWPKCHDWMDQAISGGGTVLVHCYAGVSRSSSTVISYLMWKFNLSLEEAFHHTRNCRWFINPNPGFVGQLRTFERQLTVNRGVLTGT